MQHTYTHEQYMDVQDELTKKFDEAIRIAEFRIKDLEELTVNYKTSIRVLKEDIVKMKELAIRASRATHDDIDLGMIWGLETAERRIEIL